MITTAAPSRPGGARALLALAGLATWAGALLAACADDPGDPGDPEQLLGYDLLPELELTVAPADVAALEADPRTYVPATIGYRGHRYGPVGVRVKGQSSFLPFSQKPSLRIHVSEYDRDARFWGLEDLTLDNMRSDPSMMHERLAYRVAREAGLTASRANHALLTVNGEPYGLYANVETVNPQMLAGHFDQAAGPLFEATDVDFVAADVPRYHLEAGADDRRLLDGLAAALAIPDADQALAAAAAYVDIAHFQRYWAMTTIIGQFDGFPYSMPGDDYFVYADPASQKLWFIPWGMDETFLSGEFPPLQTSSVLAARCQASPACKQGYVDQVWELLAMTERIDLEGERVRIAAELADEIAADPRRPYGADEIAEGQTQLGYFIRGRRELLGQMIPP